jgi:hypothetical protein
MAARAKLYIKLFGIVVAIASAGGSLMAQTCHRSVSFAMADASGVHPFLGSGNWIEKWIKSNQKKHPDTCFSQVPISGTDNFVIVLSKSNSYLSGLDPVVRTNTNVTTTPVSGSGSVTTGSGVWTYRYNGTETATTTTTTNENAPYTISESTIFAFAYRATGAVVSKHYHVYSSKTGGDTANTAGYNLGNALAAMNARGRLLSSTVKDIESQPLLPAEAATLSQPATSPSVSPLVSFPAEPVQVETMSSDPCKSYGSTGEKNFIKENADGKILILSDGSIWEVEQVDTVDSSLWLAADDIVVMRADRAIGCFSYTLINANERAEKVLAKYLGRE